MSLNPFEDFWNAIQDFAGWSAKNQLPQAGNDGDPSWQLLYDLLAQGPPAPSWTMSDDQIKQFEYLFSSSPFYGEWVRVRDNIQYMSDYLRNTGLDWSDMLYPSRASGSGSGWSLSSDLLNYTSRNLEKFYR